MTTNLDRLTPAQLRRVDAMLAEKVMGYAGDFAPRWDGKQWLVCDEVFSDGTRGREEPVPHYTTDPAAALSLLDEYAADRDFHITWDAVSQTCSVSISDPEFTELFNGRPEPTLPLAICQAVAEAEGLELGEVVE